MSERQNHRYLLFNALEFYGKIRRVSRLRAVALWAVLVVGFAVLFEFTTFRPDVALLTGPVVTVVIVGLLLAVFWVRIRWQRRNVIVGYWQALSSPSPQAAILHLEQSMARARALPDADAMAALPKALTFAMYGHENDAVEVLRGVPWQTKAPLVQAMGLSAEGMIALLCRHDARGALELTRRARELAAVAGWVPGSQQSRRYHDACVAMCEVLADRLSDTSVRSLEASVSDDRTPIDQLRAAFALAIAMERSGDTARANELRRFVRKHAPHCAPLLLDHADWKAVTKEPREPLEGPVSAALSNSSAAPAMQTETPVREIVLKAVGWRLLKFAGMWLLLIGMFVLIKVMFSSSE